MNCTYYYLGVYFSVTKSIVYNDTYRICPVNEKHYQKCISTWGNGSETNFCPMCGTKLVNKEFEQPARYLTVDEICERIGVEEETFLHVGECSDENRKYFALNRKYDGVAFECINPNRFTEVFKDFYNEPRPDEVLCNALRNRAFHDIFNSLEREFGHDFNVHVGVFTSIM